MAKLVKVRVTTNAKNESVYAVGEDTLEVSVREKPAGNLANLRVVELIARMFGVPSKKIRILKGHRRPSKTLSIEV
ncbi:MAG: DUF167 domain-containing protein [Candidatus Pacebacteria bacterium]|nr:DUF167 domain-containing protein [Candidatus Paceibacterota bacterium]